jgi:hypothetical protein
LGRDRFERRAYRAIKDTLPAGSIVYPTNATPGVISALAHRGGESYGEAVIRLAKAQDWLVEVA